MYKYASEINEENIIIQKLYDGFEKIMEFILNLRESIGFRSVVLYSVPNSKDSNKPLNIYERFNFISFKDYME